MKNEIEKEETIHHDHHGELMNREKQHPGSARIWRGKKTSRVCLGKGEQAPAHLKTYCTRPRCWCPKKHKKAVEAVPQQKE